MDRQGGSASGQLRAADAADATRRLLAQGLRPVQVEPVDGAGAPGGLTAASQAGVTGLGTPLGSPRRGRIGKRHLQGLLQELGTLLQAGISLSDAMPALVSAYARQPLGPALALAQQRLRAGATLSAALEQPGLDWPPYVDALMKAGEASGEMAHALHDAAAQMAHELATANELRNALVYPAVLVLAGVAAVLIIFVGVVPRFAGFVKSSRAEIPEISRWVIETGVTMQQNLGAIGLGAAAAAALLASLASQPAVRGAALQALASLPAIGPWLRSVDIGRWALVLGALLGNRVPIVDALRLSAGTLQLRPLREAILRGGAQLREGRSLSEILEQEAWFPEVRLSLVRVGERSGELPRMLRALGETETQSSRTLQKRVLALVEPAAILIIGAVIGVIMVAVMMAITSLNVVAG